MLSSRALGVAALLALSAWACGPFSTPRAREALAPSEVAPAASVRLGAVVPSDGPRPALPEGWRFAPSPSAASDRGLVVSEDAEATRAGVEALRRGGNAVDAAVATALALAVVFPEAGNLGGGGFAVVHLAADGTDHALDFRETAPAGARRDMYLDATGRPTAASRDGALSVGVPGTVAGLFELSRRFGRLAWRDLVAPAAKLAREGFVVDERLARAIVERRDELARHAASAALYLPSGEPPKPGTKLRNPELAATLERLARGGKAAFYAGKTAELIEAEMRRDGGLVTRRDLAGYEAKWRAPIVATYRGARIVSMPPPSSGGLAIAMLANVLGGDDLAALGWHSPAHLHLFAEAERRVFAERNAALGDPDFVKLPTDAMLSRPFAERLRRSIGRRATPSSEIRPGARELVEPTHTTHLSVVDREGAAVSLTTTLNLGFGSGVVVAGAGFLLNDEMDDFTVKPGEANAFGLVQGEANAIEPGKRMLSSMSPTIVLDPRGEVQIVTGARGGSRIISATWQVVSNLVDFGLEPAVAIAAPRVHHQHLPDALQFERGGLDEELTRELGSLGYALEPVERVAMAPTIARRDGRFVGSPDPRRGGLALAP